MFRDDFVWGVASSAYQIEGRDPQDEIGRASCRERVCLLV